jgi:hypothetical protein
VTKISRRNPEGRQIVGKKKTPLAFLLGLTAFGLLTCLLMTPSLRGQDNLKYLIDEDCQAFDIASDNSIVYAVPHLKAVKRLIFERDDIGIATGPGKIRRIVEADKFMPFPPPSGYIVNSLAWSPDAHRIAVNMTLQLPPPGFDEKKEKKKGDLGDDDNQQDDDRPPLSAGGGGRALALLENDGREIKVAGSKTRFIEGAADGTWLADGSTLVYLTGGGPFAIARVTPADGKSSTLFEGHTFSNVIWDAKNNRAFAIGDNLGLHRGLTLVQLDLLHETVREISGIAAYQGSLALSPSGTKIGYFEDGDTIDVIDIATRTVAARVRAGFGRFGWSRDERRVLLKRGDADRSNILLWVGLYDDSFQSILHDLQFRDFEIAPDGLSIVVTVPGKRVLKVYPLQ